MDTTNENIGVSPMFLDGLAVGKTSLWRYSGSSETVTIFGTDYSKRLSGIFIEDFSISLENYLELYVHPNDRTNLSESLLHISGEKKNFKTRYRLRENETDTWFWVESFGKITETANGFFEIYGGIREISDQVILENKFFQNDEIEEHAQETLDATPLCCNCWDEQYNNFECNLEAYKLFGFSGKQEYLERFEELFPPYQPNGRLSWELFCERIDKAFATGYQRFEWMHRKPGGEPMPCEITFVRMRKNENEYFILAFTRDLREYKAMLRQVREIDDRIRLMFDTAPLACNFWDENFENIDCNLAAVKMFGVGSKREYLEHFMELSPEYQSCGKKSHELIREFLREAFEKGSKRFKWMHQTIEREPIPSELILHKVRLKDRDYVIGYSRDLREYEAAIEKADEAEKRYRIMLDTMPFCCHFWNENIELTDCNEMSVKLFGLGSKEEYIARFSDLSPEFQPNGQKSEERMREMVENAFKNGHHRFRWMHRTIFNSPLPSEVILIRVDQENEESLVIGYIWDMRKYHEMESRVEETESQIERIMDSSPVCCNIWDENFNIIDCNRSAVRLFDLKDKQEYLDRFFDLSPEHQPEGLPSRELIYKHLANAYRNGYERFEWTHKNLNSRTIPVDVTLTRIDKGDRFVIIAHVLDMHKLESTQKELKMERNLFLETAISNPVCFAIFDLKSGKIRFTTPYTKYTLGFSPGDLIFNGFSDRDAGFQLCEMLQKNRTIKHYPVTVTDRSGKQRDMSVDMHPVNFYGEDAAMIWLMDIV